MTTNLMADNDSNSVNETIMPQPAQLTTIPAELLLEIFTWLTWDEIDLNMLSVSRSIRTVLLSHPTVRALGVFRLQRSKKGVSVVINDTKSQAETSIGSVSLCPAISIIVDHLLSQPWFHRLNTTQLQASVTRRLIRIHWRSYLTRDGRLQKPGKMHELTRTIASLWWDAYAQAEKGDMCILPDAVVEYPWTHLQMWPIEGRIVIRDQLENAWEEIDVPIVRLVEQWKGKGDGSGKG